MLWRRKSADRYELVAAADRARAKGRTRKAIAGYLEALAVAPGDLGIHAKLAPLLAREGRKEEALASFGLCAEGHLKAGFVERALSVRGQAATFYPAEYELWEEIARLHLLQQHPADAFAALYAGGRRLAGSRDWGVAVRVLERALQISPWQPAASVLLARALARCRRRGDALDLLDEIDPRLTAAERRRARLLALRLSPTPRRLFRWIGALLRSTEAPP